MIYKGISSEEFNVKVESVGWPLNMPLKSMELEIPGRHGSYDFKENTFSSFPLPVDIAYTGEYDNLTALREMSRKISAWLYSRKYEKLIFKSEADRFYLARCYDTSQIESLFVIGSAQIVFHCQPFARSIELYSERNVVTSQTHTTQIASHGTHDTPPVIIMKNQGASTINEFSFRMEYEAEE